MRGYQEPFIREMIREAVESLGSPTTNQEIIDWVESRYPVTNRSSIQCHLVICTVNHPSRVHYPQNCRVREPANDPRYDFLYSPGRGQVEWYRPQVHGVWGIGQDAEGSFAIRRDGGRLHLSWRAEARERDAQASGG